MASIADKTIVLIAGQPKAGTTSLFDWLAQHPEIGAGKVKEVRFFLDSNYPLQSPNRFDGANFQDYLALFDNVDRPFILDASPDYLGCDTPLLLPGIASSAKAIIIVREPVDRLKSAYRFYRSRGYIPQDFTFDQYIAVQHAEGVGPFTKSHMRALDHCRADHYVARWREAYGDDLLVLDFPDLKDRPEETLAKVLRFIGLEPTDKIQLSHGNKTKNYASPKVYRLYNRLRRGFAHATLAMPWVYRMLRPVGRIFVKSLEVERRVHKEVDASEETIRIINLYSKAG